MPFQHSIPVIQKVSQDTGHAVLTSTPRVPIEGTPEVPQLRAHLDRGPNMKKLEPSRNQGRGFRRSRSFSGAVGFFPGMSTTTFKCLGEDGEEEGIMLFKRKVSMVLRLSMLL
ncbi:hypothetical protein O181_098109 [Austropuccinia psidii MF-1]|uniref:Uncharacterized protein n=1 Tax=Austropuccinia psidii MF-1 TaxID=1389203 RepID=A0A9Q3PE79_9BASI|nr:hypothetical protein [Austropuccinia psidii MF-1]